jgi:hypothetical protein
MECGSRPWLIHATGWISTLVIVLCCCTNSCRSSILPVENATTNPDKISNDALRAFFHKYGTNGSITYEAFEHLLYNLGLGNIYMDHNIGTHRTSGGFFKSLHPNHEHTSGVDIIREKSKLETGNLVNEEYDPEENHSTEDQVTTDQVSTDQASTEDEAGLTKQVIILMLQLIRFMQ